MSFCCYLIIGNCVCYHKYNNSTSKIQKPQSKLPCGLFINIFSPLLRCVKYAAEVADGFGDAAVRIVAVLLEFERYNTVVLNLAEHL